MSFSLRLSAWSCLSCSVHFLAIRPFRSGRSTALPSARFPTPPYQSAPRLYCHSIPFDCASIQRAPTGPADQFQPIQFFALHYAPIRSFPAPSCRFYPVLFAAIRSIPILPFRCIPVQCTSLHSYPTPSCRSIPVHCFPLRTARIPSNPAIPIRSTPMLHTPFRSRLCTPILSYPTTPTPNFSLTARASSANSISVSHECSRPA